MPDAQLPIVCFSSNDWSDIPSSKAHIMRYLARSRTVLFVETIGIHTPTMTGRDLARAREKLNRIRAGVRHVENGLYVWSPPAIPFHGSRVARIVNRYALMLLVRLVMRRLRMRDAIVWSYLPHVTDVVERLPAARRVYHCIDDYAEFSNAPVDAIRSAEARMTRLADLTVVSARRLFDLHQRNARRILHVPHAVDVDHFGRAGASVPSDLPHDGKPIAGFVGRIADWIDLELLARCADELPEWNLVLVGPANLDLDELTRRSNVYWLGRKDHAEVRDYIARFDVALVPFVMNDLARSVNPLKLYEYLAVGRPVVSVPLPEVEPFADVITIAESAAFPAAIAATREAPEERRDDERRAAVAGFGWDAVADRILSELEAERVPALA